MYESMIYNMFDNGRTFVLTVGLPNSGKSSFVEYLVGGYIPEEELDVSVVVISPDEIRKELTGSTNDQSKNREVFYRIYQTMEDELKAGRNVVIDATNVRLKYRSRLMNIAKKYAKHSVCCIKDRPLVEVVMNNMERDRPVPSSVLETMFLMYKSEPPTLDEGYDAIIRV